MTGSGTIVSRGMLNGFRIAAFLGAFVSLTGVSAAKVASLSGNGFEISETEEIAATPAHVYDRLVHPEAWWDDAYTVSGSAVNLSLDAVASHCFCEELPDGGTVEHSVVVYVDPGKRLVMRGALGPLQGMGVASTLSVDLAAKGDGTALTVTYAVGGYAPDGFRDLSSKVDAMVESQVGRLKKDVETGKPE